jgi:hypothetical protein
VTHPQRSRSKRILLCRRPSLSLCVCVCMCVCGGGGVVIQRLVSKELIVAIVEVRRFR